ncbi:MAG: VOC family protein [Halieaceae bacterium]
MSENNNINYVEFAVRDLAATKQFFQAAFGWEFVDYGPDYASFQGRGIDGGFFRSEQVATTTEGAALIVLYAEDLEASQARVEQAGGKVVKPIFSFPGGRRFHFSEPGGNELAVWSE